ncbi:MAG: hypothetical protein NTY90_05790 [Candidatus Micrarchaeota archaeon]|nr:hypothetical protein [Candidatus Micrarchaeota archaeon]
MRLSHRRQGQQAAAQASPQGEAAKATGPSTAWKVFGILFGLVLGAMIILAIGGISILAIASSLGSDLNNGGNGNGATQTCADKAGSVTCGHCPADAGGSHAGTCRYCQSGYTCSGEICGEMTCKSASQVPGGATATPVSGSNQPGSSGYGVIREFPMDSRTGCPVQGSTSSRGNVDLQCSQMVPTGRCSFQSCQCYYSDVRGSTSNVYYHSSDGAYFPCSGNGHDGIDCRAAAQAVASHCVPQ